MFDRTLNMPMNLWEWRLRANIFAGCLKYLSFSLSCFTMAFTFSWGLISCFQLCRFPYLYRGICLASWVSLSSVCLSSLFHISDPSRSPYLLSFLMLPLFFFLPGLGFLFSFLTVLTLCFSYDLRLTSCLISYFALSLASYALIYLCFTSYHPPFCSTIAFHLSTLRSDKN